MINYNMTLKAYTKNWIINNESKKPPKRNVLIKNKRVETSYAFHFNELTHISQSQMNGTA